MKKFMDENFLLETETAKTLYHDYAKNMPIVDYHCHINPKEIYDNRQYSNIYEPWLEGDHYKWRQMRTNATDENFITNKETDAYEKFLAFAKTLDKAIGNPLYHWSHLELQKYFDYDGRLGESTAKEVWDTCNAKLSTPELSVRGIINQSNVALIGTTDDPIDDLYYHKEMKKDDTFKTQIVPSWRPDKAVNVNLPTYKEYITSLSEVAGVEINDFDSLCDAIAIRLDYFKENGCLASDHGLDEAVYIKASKEELNAIMQKAFAGEAISVEETRKYKTEILLFLGRAYAKRNIVMQLHFSAVRNTNSRMFDKLGADTGFDCMGNTIDAFALTAFLNDLESTDELPKTILYSLNEGDNQMLGTVIGAFQSAEVKGKMQHGSAWWFNDTKEGMEKQLKSLANLSLLGNFVGMLTDSRSYLSYTRHEYFRRILCNVIGNWVENGELPNDTEWLGQIVMDISYNNAKEYFGC
ncbi:MAG: glucuronate isomerase [Clostridia bacterium]